MNRKHSHSFKPYGSSSMQNRMLKSMIGLGFRTLWKDRDTHQLSIQAKITQKSKKNDQKSPNYSTTSQRQNANQQEMKALVKMMKKSSNESEIISKPLQIPKKKLSCQSSRSIHFETKLKSQSRVFNDTQGHPALTLDQLEKKIQQLIQIRLKKKSKSKSFFNSQIFQDDLDKQLAGLIKEVRNHNRVNTNTSFHEEEIKDEDRLDLSIKQINQKINIIQKIIAENCTSSEMMKKYYSASKNRLTKNHSFSTSKATQIQTCLQSSSFFKNERKAPSIHFETTSMSNYVKPPRASYFIDKCQQAPYLASRQPIQRSNYQRQFLNYGVVPTYSSKLDNSSVCTDTGIRMKNRISNYQSQFKQKKTKLVDSITLDCRQDKFRNPKINFIPSKQASNTQKLKKLQKNTKKMENNQTQDHDKADPFESSANKENYLKKGVNLKTEHKQKFIGKKCTIESYMKDRNLNKLKQSYKLSFNA